MINVQAWTPGATDEEKIIWLKQNPYFCAKPFNTLHVEVSSTNTFSVIPHNFPASNLTEFQ